MTRIYVDATTLIALGTVGELELLTEFDGTVILLPSITQEVTTEPAATNVSRFCSTSGVQTTRRCTSNHDGRAQEILNEQQIHGDVRLIASVLTHTERGESVAVVSDDRRVRTVAGGLGADVTGTIGVVVRAVASGMEPADAKRLVRRLDEQGLHMTAALRDRADELIEREGKRVDE